MPQRSKKPRCEAVGKQRRVQRTKRHAARRDQHWVPDLRDPRVRAELRREGKLLAKHPENDAIDAWIEAVYDWSEWPEWSDAKSG